MANVEIEWIAGVVRAYPDGKSSANKDAYLFSATVRARGDEAELIGVSSTPPAGGLKDLCTALRAQGFKSLTWERFAPGSDQPVKKVRIKL